MLLQHSGKDEGGWGGWWQGNGQCHWGCTESGWERDVESDEGWDCFKVQERNKQTQMKWFLFLKKKVIWIDMLSLKVLVLYCFKIYLCMNKTHEKQQGKENFFKNFAK